MTYLDSISGGDIWKITGFILTAIFVGISYVYTAFRMNRTGITSEYAAFLAYIFGVISLLGYSAAATILAILSLVLLSSKDYFKKLEEKFSRKELSNTLKFAVISLVMLPLLPDVKFSLISLFEAFHLHLPFSHSILAMEFFNPRSVWMFVVVMAGVEYVGYILSKTLGNKGGAILSGAIGGLISSTAVTAAMTNKSHQSSENHASLVAATLVASIIMCARVIVVASVFNPAILSTIIFPAMAILLGLAGSVWYFYKKSLRAPKKSLVTEKKEEYESPFELLPAIKFALVILGIKFISGIGVLYQEYIPVEAFYYILGAISGLADVDIITMEMGQKSQAETISLVVATTTILIAVISNNIVKALLAYRMGEKKFGEDVAKSFAVAIFLGLVVILAMNIMTFFG